MNPITNFELGKMQHREYEAEASRYWNQTTHKGEQRSLTPKHKLVLALSSIVTSIVKKY